MTMQTVSFEAKSETLKLTPIQCLFSPGGLILLGNFTSLLPAK